MRRIVLERWRLLNGGRLILLCALAVVLLFGSLVWRSCTAVRNDIALCENQASFVIEDDATLETPLGRRLVPNGLERRELHERNGRRLDRLAKICKFDRPKGSP